ncbi:uncharacterized protein LOC110714318 [Chenopodium quinoa]|uniref:uncharacterized protein LOC110714318 n=1 Tax=Chenopodium quinoa TaxID=63459 RepID=UPI000B78EE53|nr:uncharacterized protein LOC110714318 [Chenopodium quinoa]
MQALKESNEGTVVHWCTTPTLDPSTHVFQRVFWAFKPSIDGFNHCRPLITIDGTHLYGKYKGTLLIAMDTDANFQLFPLAFAVVEGETGDAWEWFMLCIRQFVTQRKGLCVISDRHASILKTMTAVGSGWEEPHAHHRFCIRHLASNFNSKFKNAHLKNLLGRAADARQKNKFIHYFNKIGELKLEACEWLAEKPLYKWSIYHDGGFRYGIQTTNMSECFNGSEFYFVTRRGWGKRRLQEGYEYSEKALKTIDDNLKKSAAHKVDPFDYEKGLFAVETGCGNRASGKGGHVHTVNLSKRTCICQKLTIYKLPCSHVLAVCRHRSLSYADFVDPFFRTTEYRDTYKNTFMPVPDVSRWPPYVGPKIFAPPTQKRAPRRTPSSQMVHSGPLDHSVLIYQEDHRSEDVWKGVTRGDKVFSCRENLFSLTRNWVVDDRMLSYVKQAGFYGVHRLRCSVGLDRPLITALVERWRQETHTFHLAVGEATINLGDVAC